MTPFMEDLRLACGRAMDRGLREITVVYMGTKTRERMRQGARDYLNFRGKECDRDEIAGFKIYVVNAEEYLEMG